jgi:ribosome-associated protein
MKLSVPTRELEITYVRSSGPGGQNVNKVNSKAQVRWNITEADIPVEAKLLLMEKLASRLGRDGSIVVACDEYRDQPRNREACIEKLQAIVDEALFKPKKRKKTKPTYGSRIRNAESKKRHSDKKRMRRIDG